MEQCAIYKVPEEKCFWNGNLYISYDLSIKQILTVQAKSDVNGSDVGDCLQVLDAGTLQLSRGRSVTYIYPADSLLSINKVHCHRLLSGDGGEPSAGATQGGASNIVEIGNQQDRKTIHWL